MEGVEKLHTDKYKEIMNNWNYDASCMLTSLPVWDLENLKRLIFVVQSVHETNALYMSFSFSTGYGLISCNVLHPSQVAISGYKWSDVTRYQPTKKLTKGGVLRKAQDMLS
jgi:hypothetical protein